MCYRRTHSFLCQESEWEALHERYEAELADLKEALGDKQAALDSVMLQLTDSRRDGLELASERDGLKARVSDTTEALQGQVRTSRAGVRTREIPYFLISWLSNTSPLSHEVYLDHLSFRL